MRAKAPESSDAAMPHRGPAHRAPLCRRDWARWPHRPALQRRDELARCGSYRAARRPKWLEAPPPQRRSAAARCGGSCGNVELAPLAQHQPRKKKRKYPCQDGHAFPGVSRNARGARLEAGVWENHLRDGGIAEARLRAALISHFDLDGVGAGVKTSEGHADFDLLGIDLLGTKVGIGLCDAPGHLRCEDLQVGALRFDLDFLSIHVVPVGNDPTHFEDLAVHARADAKCD